MPRGSKRAPRVHAGRANHISAGLSAPPVMTTASASSSGRIPQAAATQTAGRSLLRMKLSATANPARPTASGAIHHQPSAELKPARLTARIAKQARRYGRSLSSMSISRSRRASSRTATSDSFDGFEEAESTSSRAGRIVRALNFTRCASAWHGADFKLHLLDQLNFFGQGTEVAVTVLADDDQVLDPHSQLTGQVDAGLDRHHFARRQHVVGAGRETRRLVHLQPDPVAEAVAEALAEPGGGDRLAGNPVKRFAVDSGGNRIERRRLSAADGLVDLTGALSWLANGKSSRAIGAIAVELRPHVEDDQLPLADLALARLGVRQRPVRPGGDDRREGGVAPELADSRLGGAGDLALAATAEASFQAPAPDLVGELGGGGNRSQLLPVLDPAQLLDCAAGRHRLDPVGELAAQALQQTDRDVVVLEAEAATEMGGDAAQPVVGDRDRLPALDLGRSTLGVAEVGEEEAGVGAADAGAVGTGEAGQVADVDQLGDQGQVELARSQRSREAVAAAPHALPETPRWRASVASASR